MSSLRQGEGYFMLDHRDSPGIPDEVLVPFGFGKGAGRGFHETATYTCNHCTGVVIMNPQRSRPREWCSGCDSYICDQCGAVMAQTKECRTFQQVIDEMLEQTIQSNLIAV